MRDKFNSIFKNSTSKDQISNKFQMLNYIKYILRFGFSYWDLFAFCNLKFEVLETASNNN